MNVHEMMNRVRELRIEADRVYRQTGIVADAQKFHDEAYKLELQIHETIRDHPTPLFGVPQVPSTDDQRRMVTMQFMGALISTVRLASSDMTDEQAHEHYALFARDVHVFAEELAKRLYP